MAASRDGAGSSHEFAAQWRPLKSGTHLTVSLGQEGFGQHLRTQPIPVLDLPFRTVKGVFHNGDGQLTDRYGLGIMSIPYYAHEAYGHGGNIDSFHAMAGHFLEDGDHKCSDQWRQRKS